MTRIAHVLCPVDFSEISQHALDHASAIAASYKARLTLLYVFPNFPGMDLPPLVLEDADRQRLLRDLQQMAAAVPKEVSVTFAIQEAPYIHDEILAQAGATQADLLVLGTHGRSGFQRLFLGSVTEKVIRKATCPTLVVPPRAPDVAADAPIRFQQILCAVDFSESSLAALTYASDLARETGAQLTVLHVVEVLPVLAGEPGTPVPDLSGVREAAEHEARRKLHDLIPEQARPYTTVETAVIEGRAYREIVRCAADRKADVVVVGVHGRGVIDRLLFGSTTHHVIRESTSPVLIVRRP